MPDLGLWWFAVGSYLGAGFVLGFSADPLRPTRWWSHLLCTVGWLPILVVAVVLNGRAR